MQFQAIVLTVCVLATLPATPARAGTTTLHPPPALLQSFGSLRTTDSLGGLPEPIRRGTFALAGGTKSESWALAAPGGKWNATDVIVDPSLPGRRMIFAACNETVCALHYERGGVAHVFLVMALMRSGNAWKATWLAMGNRPLENARALESLLENRSSLDYHDVGLATYY